MLMNSITQRKYLVNNKIKQNGFAILKLNLITLMQLCISWCISLCLCGVLNFSACPTWSFIKLYASSFNRSWMFSDCTSTRTKMPFQRFVSYITHASHHFCLWYSILNAQSFIKAASLYLFLFSRQVGTTSSGMLLHMNGKFTMRAFKSSLLS